MYDIKMKLYAIVVYHGLYISQLYHLLLKAAMYALHRNSYPVFVSAMHDTIAYLVIICVDNSQMDMV